MHRAPIGRGSSGSTAVVPRSRVMDDQRFYDLENAADELEVSEQEEQSIYMRHIGSLKGVKSGVKSKCAIPESALRLEAELGKGTCTCHNTFTFVSFSPAFALFLASVRSLAFVVSLPFALPFARSLPHSLGSFPCLRSHTHCIVLLTCVILSSRHDAWTHDNVSLFTV